MIRRILRFLFIASAFEKEALTILIKQQSFIIKQLKTMATKIEELTQLASDQTQELTDLRASVNTMEANNAKAIQELKDIIATGGGTSDAQLQGVIDILQSNKQAIADTKADVESLDDDA